MSHKISIITLGCKVNQYDTDAMLAVLSKGGFEVFEGLEIADKYIINTCAVTAEAERKSRQYVGKILKVNPDAQIYVCGCASQNNFTQFAKDNVIYISGTENKIKLAQEIVKNSVIDDENFEKDGFFDKIICSDFDVKDKFEENSGIINFKTRHFIKVQDGCNNFCSYCIIPYLRGRSRSRSMSNIFNELDALIGKTEEVVVTGINLSAYGKDMNVSLKDLILALQKYPFRIRLGSLEVGVINREFLQATTELKKFCPHFHLSLQSGDDEVLKSMNRHYSTEEYFSAVQLIREFYPQAGITTDIIVGFPTETEEEFENSMNFAKKVGFSDIHVFPYSSRKGTVAGKMPTLSAEVLESRQQRMLDVKSELRKKYLLSQLGKNQEVLFETKEDGMWVGHSTNYIKVYSLYGKRNTLQTITPTMLYNDGVRV